MYVSVKLNLFAVQLKLTQYYNSSMCVGVLIHVLLSGSSPGGIREFEVGTALARIRKQLLN